MRSKDHIITLYKKLIKYLRNQKEQNVWSTKNIPIY